MSGHTPGPWKLQPMAFLHQIAIAAEGYGTLAVIYGSTGENAKNAELMVAAPDLLKALEEMMDLIGLSSSVASPAIRKLIDKSAAVIARAKGEA